MVEWGNECDLRGKSKRKMKVGGGKEDETDGRIWARRKEGNPCLPRPHPVPPRPDAHTSGSSSRLGPSSTLHQ